MALTVRLATAADFDAILAIDENIYEGNDHVYSEYPRYVTDPQRRCFVGILNGKIVGFIMHYIVDDNSTTIVQASRIAPGLQGAGLWTKLRNAAMALVRQDFPSLQRMATTTHLKSLYLTNMKIENKDFNFDFIMERNVYFLELRDDSSATVGDVDASHVAACDKSQLVTIMSNQDNQWRLFPHGRIILSWEPYRLLDSNYSKVTDTCHVAFHTSSKHGDVTTLSLSHVMHTKLGVRYDLEIYTEHLDQALPHVQCHLQEFIKLTANVKKSNYIIIHTPSTCDSSHFITQVLRYLPVKLMPYGVTTDCVCALFERRLNTRRPNKL